MRTYLSDTGRTFTPREVERLPEAFDAARAAVQRFDGVGDHNRDQMRETLAKRIIELWDASNPEPDRLRDATLRASVWTRRADDVVSYRTGGNAPYIWRGAEQGAL